VLNFCTEENSTVSCGKEFRAPTTCSLKKFFLALMRLTTVIVILNRLPRVTMSLWFLSTKLECGPMPNVMVALPNTGGALCSTPQSLADAH